MELDWRKEGRLDTTQKELVDFLDRMMFVYPAYQIQIAGLRAGIVGSLQLVNKNSTVLLEGHLNCDGSTIESVSNITVTISA